jgi:tetratricopeptide (TPR) repeat protein
MVPAPASAAPTTKDQVDALNAQAVEKFQAKEYEEAVALFERVEADRERVLGGDHPTTLVSRHGVAFYLGELGRREEALALYERVAADAERVLGREDAISRSARGGAALMRLRLQDDQPMPRELREILRWVPAGPPGASSGAGDERSARAAGADPTDHRASSLYSSDERWERPAE